MTVDKLAAGRVGLSFDPLSLVNTVSFCFLKKGFRIKYGKALESIIHRQNGTGRQLEQGWLKPDALWV